MTYTQIGILFVVTVVVLDLFVLRTRLVTRKGFWVAYAIVLFFQFVTNGLLTSLHVFTYADTAIIGNQPADDGPPPFFGQGRIFFQPFEDVLMGFSLCLLAMALWVFWGRRGVQRTPMSGPPIWRRSGRVPTAPTGTDSASPGRTGDSESTT